MNNEVLIETNSHQTPITKEFKDSMTSEAYSDLVDFINTVPFVKALISPDRPRAKDLPKDKHGKLIVDFERPHILEDISYFTETRDNFKKHGRYTSARFSRDPRSEYRKFWDEEERRSLYGMVRESDGEWIPGYLYFYWNYGRIDLTVPVPGAERNPDGTVRTDREEHFPDIWEIDYFYYHYIDAGESAGKYGALLKCRGMGASFKSANMVIRNFFLIRKSKSYLFAYHDDYLYDDGIATKMMVNEGFMQKHTAFRKLKLKGTMDHLKSGYKNKRANNAEDGYLSEVMGVNTKNPNGARGKRGKLIVHEEAGSHRYLLDSWRIANKSLNDKGNVFGYQLAQGTGGDEQSDFRGLVSLYYRPRAYDVYAIPNVFDRNASHQMAGFFMGEYMNRPDSYNKNGVTDIIRNLKIIFEERVLWQIELDDPEEIAKKKAEAAITPLEAITSMEHSPFPKEILKDRIAHITSNYAEHSAKLKTVKFERTGEQVSFYHSPNLIQITEYPYLGKQQSRAGITISKMPDTHGNGNIPNFRYIIGVDTIDDDGGEGSMFSFIVMDLWKDEIVAWYLGRELIAEDNYEQLLCVALFYNATINYEKNLKGLYSYFKNSHALGYLADEPSVLADKGYTKGGQLVGNKSKGTRATKQVNAHGRRSQAGWLRKQHEYYTDKVGAETVDDIEWLRECNMWENMGNYDKVSAGNMLFIYREELKNLTGNTRFDKVTKADYLDDPFFGETKHGGLGLVEGIETTSNELNF